MRFHRSYTFAAPCDTVYDLLTDEAFQQDRVSGTGRDPQVRVGTAGGGDVVTIVLHLLTDGAPGAMKRFVGDSLTVTDERRWGAAGPDGSRTADLAVDVDGAPVRMRGQVTLSPKGDGSVLDVSGDLTCSIPLVGKAVEGQIAEGIGAQVDAEAAAVTARLGR